MCFYEDQPECGASEVRKSRKQHRCDGCSAPIEIGQLCRYSSGIAMRHCGVCELTRYMIHVIELSHDCRWWESWCYDDFELWEVAESYSIPPGSDPEDEDLERERYTSDEGQRFMLFERRKSRNTREPKEATPC